MKQIRNIPWHPFLAGIFYILAIYQTNAEHHPISVIWIPICGALVIVSILFGIGALLSRSFRAGALFCTSTVVLLLIYPRLQENIELLTGFDPSIWLFILLAAGVGILLYKLDPETRKSLGLLRILNLVALCCLASTLLVILASRVEFTGGRSAISIAPFMDEQLLPKDAADIRNSEAPDIIHIVMDGYARNDVLQRLYSFDNADFLDQLRAQGFYVAEHAAANYCQTGLSMSSALNSSYLDFPKELEESNDRKILKIYFNQSSIPAFLRNSGYTLRLYDSGYYLTDSMDGAEIIETMDAVWNEFSYEVVRRSTLWLPIPVRNSFMVDLGNRTLYRQHRLRIFNAFDLLQQEPSSLTQPSYTLVHMLTPHPPFIFADSELRETPQLPYSVSDGSHRIGLLQGGSQEYRRLYVSQLNVVNQMMLDCIQQILANAQRPLVVVLQSDHGPGSSLDWNDLEKSDSAERLGILTALYFSDAQYEMLYPEITPVNIWRVILNKYFLKEHMPLLEDKSYLSSWPQPYVFREKASK